MTLIKINYRHWHTVGRANYKRDLNPNETRWDIRIHNRTFRKFVVSTFVADFRPHSIYYFQLSGTRNLSQRVQYLMNEILLKTLLLSADAASKVDEIHIQLSVLQRQCNYRDQPLCDTLKVKSFEEIGFIECLKVVMELSTTLLLTFNTTLTFHLIEFSAERKRSSAETPNNERWWITRQQS